MPVKPGFKLNAMSAIATGMAVAAPQTIITGNCSANRIFFEMCLYVGNHIRTAATMATIDPWNPATATAVRISLPVVDIALELEEPVTTTTAPRKVAMITAPKNDSLLAGSLRVFTCFVLITKIFPQIR